MMKKICLIDDTPELLKNFTEFLRMEGFEVWPFAAAKDALDKIVYDRPDLIITDLWMPGMDGLAFIERVRGDVALREVPIIIFSAKAIQEYEEQARRLGVTGFIVKPAALEDILLVINPILNI